MRFVSELNMQPYCHLFSREVKGSLFFQQYTYFPSLKNIIPIVLSIRPLHAASLNSMMGEIIQDTIISTKTFNEMAGLQGRKDHLSLEGNHVAVLDAGYYEGLSPEYVGSSTPLHVDPKKSTHLLIHSLFFRINYCETHKTITNCAICSFFNFHYEKREG